jgi:hypothetical protein
VPAFARAAPRLETRGYASRYCVSAVSEAYQKRAADAGARVESRTAFARRMNAMGLERRTAAEGPEGLKALSGSLLER